MAASGRRPRQPPTRSTRCSAFGPVLSIKLLSPARSTRRPPVPTLPCLDHEAMLHEGIPPHAAAYVQDAPPATCTSWCSSPAARRIEIDTVSTWGEYSPESHGAAARRSSHSAFPSYRMRVHRAVVVARRTARRRRVPGAGVAARRAAGTTTSPRVKADIDRLQIIGSLMEKQSRVASWGVRTVTGPLLAAAGVVLFLLLGGLTSIAGRDGRDCAALHARRRCWARRSSTTASRPCS